MAKIEEQIENYHSEELQEIISAPPHWLVNWGMLIFITILIFFGALAGIIQSPDIVKGTLVITSYNEPKPVLTKIAGRLLRVVVSENDIVKAGEAMGYMESTGNHEKVIGLLSQLRLLQSTLSRNQYSLLNTQEGYRGTDLGELQSNYETFYLSYLKFKASTSYGINLERRRYLMLDIGEINKQNAILHSKLTTRKKEFEIARLEYKMHEKLFAQKVEAYMELKNEEAKFLAKQEPLNDIESSLISNRSLLYQKQKELLELEGEINDEKLKFNQALNTFISEIERWKQKYILTAPQSGRVILSRVIQVNKTYKENEELFYITQDNKDLFGEVLIKQNSLGKVKKGQAVLVKLESYPFEQYGMIRGHITFISDVPTRDSVFSAVVKLNINDVFFKKQKIILKNGLIGEAEIITEESSLLRKLLRNFTKLLNTH